MDAPKEKITSKKDLEIALSFVIVDDWLEYPLDENLTLEENIKRYNEHVYNEQMKMVAEDFDICIDENDDECHLF